MNKYTLLLFFISIFYPAFSQNILVQPYLQDAESTFISIMWETDGGSTHTIDWGLSSANLNNSETAVSISSSGTNLIHKAKLSSLSANTRYYYQVHSDGQSSLVFDFITPPLKSSNQSFNLVAMSDMQKDGSNPTIFNQVVHDGIINYFDQEFGNDLPTDLGLILIPGDLVHNGNSYSEWQNDFFNPANPLFAHVPVYPVLGNHENNSGFYFQYFELPTNGSIGYEEHWWYKDYSNVRIIGLNSNSGYRIQEQLDWLETTLDNACADDDIDFVFAQLHHPHLSELWTPGELNYTGDVIELMETFTEDCGKPSIHFFGHTHGYSRGQSRDYEHLWVNVATAGGSIDNWGEFPNADYAEFNTSIDEYGFVVVNVTAGANPEFTLRRISRGDQDVVLNNVQKDSITLKKTDNPPIQPIASFPNGETVSPDCLTLAGDDFNDPGDFHHASHWQVASTCGDFSNPIIDSWKQYENWYNEINTQANDDLTDEEIDGLTPNTSYCWRVRYRDEHLKWSNWAIGAPFTTGDTEFTANLLLNGGGENGVDDWIVTSGSVIESLGSGECNGINPYAGVKYLAVGGLCPNNETGYSEAYQNIDVNTFSTSIDGGTVEVLFGGYLSNFDGNDQPTLHVEFLAADKSVLGTSATLTTLNSSWTMLEANEIIPINTRSINVILTGTRNSGTDNDSYFDDLFVKLDLIPGVNCSQPPTPLPVKLTKFTGTCQDGHALLTWEVSEEVNLKYYQIGRSENGQDWVTVGNELPNENTNIYNKKYSHLNWENINGKAVYYRLEIVNVDGTIDFSPIVLIKCGGESKIKIFPNPVAEEIFTISLEQSQKSKVNIEIVNLLGQVVYRKEVEATEGLNKIVIPIQQLPSGTYAVNINTQFRQWSDLLIRH